MRIPSDQKRIIQECVNHESDIKDLKRKVRLHDEHRIRVMNKEEADREARKIAMIKHEDQNRMDKVAREREFDKHVQFLKSSLNII